MESRVALALRWLAGGSYLDVADIHGVHKSTLFQCLWEVVEAINGSDIGAFRWSTTEKECAASAAAWRQLSDFDVFTDTVGAIDGLFVALRQPTARDDPRQRKYFSAHKGTYGLNVQAVCNANLSFIGRISAER